MIGVHNPSSSPDRGEGGFLADGLFSEGNHFFLSLHCPVLSWLGLTVPLQFFLVAPFSLSGAFMLLPASLHPVSAPRRSEDEAALLTRNGFSGLTPRRFLERLHRLPAPPLAWSRGRGGMQLYG